MSLPWNDLVQGFCLGSPVQGSCTGSRIRNRSTLKTKDPLNAGKSRPWSLKPWTRPSKEQLHVACSKFKLKSRGKCVKCRHSDKAPGRNLDTIASWLSSANGDHSLVLPTSEHWPLTSFISKPESWTGAFQDDHWLRPLPSFYTLSLLTIL